MILSRKHIHRFPEKGKANRHGQDDLAWARQGWGGNSMCCVSHESGTEFWHMGGSMAGKWGFCVESEDEIAVRGHSDGARDIVGNGGSDSTGCYCESR